MKIADFWRDVEDRFASIVQSEGQLSATRFPWPEEWTGRVPDAMLFPRGDMAEPRATWVLRGGSRRTRVQFQEAAEQAVAALGYAPAEWWRWLDALLSSGRYHRATDEPLRIESDDTSGDLFVDVIDDVIEASRGYAGFLRLQALPSRPVNERAAAAIVNARARRQENIKPLLRRKRFTPTIWARRAGVSRTTAYDYLAGKSYPSLEAQRALARALDLDALPR